MSLYGLSRVLLKPFLDVLMTTLLGRYSSWLLVEVSHSLDCLKEGWIDVDDQTLLGSGFFKLGFCHPAGKVMGAISH